MSRTGAWWGFLGSIIGSIPFGVAVTYFMDSAFVEFWYDRLMMVPLTVATSIALTALPAAVAGAVLGLIQYIIGSDRTRPWTIPLVGGFLGLVTVIGIVEAYMQIILRPATFRPDEYYLAIPACITAILTGVFTGLKLRRTS
jgi:hypothetical protein